MSEQDEYTYTEAVERFFPKAKGERLTDLADDETTSTKVVHVSGEVEIAETAIDVNGRYLFVFTGMSQALAAEVLKAIDQVKAGDEDRAAVALPYDGKLQIYPIIDPQIAEMPTQIDMMDRIKQQYEARKRQPTMIATSSPFLTICPKAEIEMADKIERLVASHPDVFGKPERVKVGGLLELALSKLAQLIEEGGHEN